MDRRLYLRAKPRLEGTAKQKLALGNAPLRRAANLETSIARRKAARRVHPRNLRGEQGAVAKAHRERFLPIVRLPIHIFGRRQRPSRRRRHNLKRGLTVNKSCVAKDVLVFKPERIPQKLPKLLGRVKLHRGEARMKNFAPREIVRRMRRRTSLNSSNLSLNASGSDKYAFEYQEECNTVKARSPRGTKLRPKLTANNYIAEKTGSSRHFENDNAEQTADRKITNQRLRININLNCESPAIVRVATGALIEGSNKRAPHKRVRSGRAQSNRVKMRNTRQRKLTTTTTAKEHAKRTYS